MTTDEVLGELAEVQDDLACCTKAVDELLDRRAALFRRLRDDGWTFARIAAAAGLTDAAVVKAVRRVS